MNGIIYSGVRELRLLVSGSSGGIGQAFCSLAKTHPDWELLPLSRNPRSTQIRFDALWPLEQIEAAVHSLDPLDGLLCLHGADILSPPLRHASYLQRLNALYETDLAGSIKLVKSVLPLLRPGGTIILMGWDRAALGAEGDAGEIYATVKGAIAALGKSLAASLIDRATVYVVAPGWVQTRWGDSLSEAARSRIASRTRAGRWQTPLDVARVLEALLAFPAGISTGQVIYVNRGDVTPS